MASSLDSPFHPPVIAHRGVRSKAPENTMASFRLVVDEGANWIETDVKLTHDGKPVLFHDDTLERTTNGRGAVADTNWQDLQTLDAGGWFNATFKNERVPQLNELLRFVIDRNLRINLELKPCPGRAKATTMVALIEASKIWPDDAPPPLISSFDRESLVIASQLHPDWPRGLLLDEWHDDWGKHVHACGASSIHLNATLLTKDRVHTLQDSGLSIMAYTVNEPIRAKELLHWGVKAVFSDDPGALIKAL